MFIFLIPLARLRVTKNLENHVNIKNKDILLYKKCSYKNINIYTIKGGSLYSKTIYIETINNKFAYLIGSGFLLLIFSMSLLLFFITKKYSSTLLLFFIAYIPVYISTFLRDFYTTKSLTKDDNH